MVALQPQAIKVLDSNTLTHGITYRLVTTGVFTNTQTVTIGGVVFTSVTNLSGVAGQFKIGGSVQESLSNLTNLINNPLVSNTTQVALSVADALTIQTTLALHASDTSVEMLLVSSTDAAVTTAETQTNASWVVTHTSAGFSPCVYGVASLQFVATAITAGNGVLTVEVSNDGANWTAYNRLTTNVTNTNAQTDTRVASVTLSTNSSSVVTIPDPYAFYRALVAITTDGTYTVTSYAV